jgi:CRISPR-associated protein Cas2
MFHEIHRFHEKDQVNKIYLLVIYDITCTKKRTKFAKMLNGFGYRVQKSAFELYLSPKKYIKLLKNISKYINTEEDSVRLYRLKGDGKIIMWGKHNVKVEAKDVIII